MLISEVNNLCVPTVILRICIFSVKFPLSHTLRGLMSGCLSSLQRDCLHVYPIHFYCFMDSLSLTSIFGSFVCTYVCTCRGPSGHVKRFKLFFCWFNKKKLSKNPTRMKFQVQVKVQKRADLIFKKYPCYKCINHLRAKLLMLFWTMALLRYKHFIEVCFRKMQIFWAYLLVSGQALNYCIQDSTQKSSYCQMFF